MKQNVDDVLSPAYREELSPTIPNCDDGKDFVAPPVEDSAPLSTQNATPTRPTPIVPSTTETISNAAEDSPRDQTKGGFSLPPFHALSLCASLAESSKQLTHSDPLTADQTDRMKPMGTCTFMYHCQAAPPTPPHVSESSSVGAPDILSEVPTVLRHNASAVSLRDLPSQDLFASSASDENKLPPSAISRSNFKRRRRQDCFGSDSSFEKPPHLLQPSERLASGGDGETPMKTRKRRRIANRNRALVAQDFDQILTQINGEFGRA